MSTDGKALEQFCSDIEQIDGVIVIGNDAYAKTPESLEKLLARLKEIGYDIKSLRDKEYRKQQKADPEMMERNGWSLWFANLKTEQFKCDACGHRIDSIPWYDYHCPSCGNQSKTVIHFWEGKEYDPKSLPILEFIEIYESWHWAPLKPSSGLPERVLSAIGMTAERWYYKNGLTYFDARKMEEMGKFIRHFTSLNADKWDKQSPKFRLDGSASINDIINFCNPRSPEKRAGADNLLSGFSKAVSGKELTGDEATAMIDAMANPNEREAFIGLL